MFVFMVLDTSWYQKKIPFSLSKSNRYVKIPYLYMTLIGVVSWLV